MIDLVRKHIVILAGAVLGWSGYSFYDAGQAKPEAQAKDPRLTLDMAARLHPLAASLARLRSGGNASSTRNFAAASSVTTSCA